MSCRRLSAAPLVLLALLLSLLTAPSASAQTTPTCTRPESNADGLVILNDFWGGNRYWWDDAHLTVAVAAHPSATQAQLAAISGAIQTWDAVLRDCFDGAITLTEVDRRQAADIVVHFVPTAGGVVFGGVALCGKGRCQNVIVRSDLPPSLGRDPYTPEYLGLVTLHELGHALGLGHATNLLESTDLMGYGWPDLGAPVLSDCDVDALAYIWSWALEGTAPIPPGPGPYDCSQS